jgi:dipeptidyl aminopeptidase/acylaminoacyl peptidase
MPKVTVPAVEKEISFAQPKTPTPPVVRGAPTATPTVTFTSTPWEVERIAYTTEEKGKFVLWTMNPDGTGRLRHTPIDRTVHWPLWSPSGKLLAFLSDQVDGKLNLFVMKKENQGLQQLTFYEDMELPETGILKTPLTWSPRSDQIAYLYKGQVWLVSAFEPSTPQSLAVKDPLHTVVALEWAPRRDNKYIAYLVKEGSVNYSLWLVNPRLKDHTRIAQIRNEVRGFTWMGNANHLQYISGLSDVYQCTYESFIQKPILLNPVPSMGYVISGAPVENSTLFLTLAKQTGDLEYRVAVLDKPSKDDTDSGSLKFLTDEGVEYATWSPDGSRIAYVADRELWTMDASGANRKRVAVSGILQPSWSKK